MSAARKLEPEVLEETYEYEEIAPARSSKKAEEGEGPWLVSYADLMTLLMGFFALLSSMSTPDAKKIEQVRQTAVLAFGGTLENPYEEVASKIEKFIATRKLSDKVQISVSLEGVQLTFQGTLFFGSGDFHVKPEGKELMNELAGRIKPGTQPYRFVFEGHTDSVPMSHSIIASNWELSGLRAARIAQIFEAQGYRKTALTIIGWGETKPLVKEFTEDGVPIPENQAKNRRVVIRIYDPKLTPNSTRETESI